MDDQYEESFAVGDEHHGIVIHDHSPGEIKFRNYLPQTHFLDGMYTFQKAEPQSIIPYIQDKLDILAAENCDGAEVEEQDAEGNSSKYRIDPKLLDPKKVDWDLKRRLEKRLEKLERETRKQIDNHVKSQRNKKR